MNEENTFRILLSTDNHLGFLEKDEIRGNDSFVTFDEILSIGEKLSPDFVLLGGDLFHDNKPSLSSLFKCTELLRKYSLNQHEINFKIVSNQESNFGHSNLFKYSNFNDANLNVGMPIFSIHGNHDDPVDKSNLCALDLLHASGLINLFGKNDSVERVEINPILLCKGSTKIALYGLGAIRNERLNRLWTQNKVIFLRPNSDPDSWFSVFVVHQNRVKHGASNYLPENMLPAFLDLVIWGHEHDCRIDPEWVSSSELYITQPGSSVATSLSDGEAIDKYIGLLKVIGREFKIEKVRLETVRPFVTTRITLAEEDGLDVTSSNIDRDVERLCDERLEALLVEAQSKLTGHPAQPQLPLLRLKVDYSDGFELFSTVRLRQRYVDRVANAGEMVSLTRKREQLARERVGLGVALIPESGPDSATVEDMVRQYFARAGERLRLALLNERELAVGVRMFVEKDSGDMVTRVVEMQVEQVLAAIRSRVGRITEGGIEGEIGRIVEAMRCMSSGEEGDEEDLLIGRLMQEVSGASIVDLTVVSDEEEQEVAKARPSRGRGRGRGRGGRGFTGDVEMYDEVNGESAITGKRKDKADSSLKKEPTKRKKTVL